MTQNPTQSYIQVPWIGKVGPIPSSISIDGEFILIAIAITWIIIDRLFGSRVAKKLGDVFAPIEEERALNYLLAQVGLITRSSRVVLAAFHNGKLDGMGYHLARLTTINSYTAEGCKPMAKPIQALPIGTIMYELEQMIAAYESGDCWTITRYSDDLPQPCKDHLVVNDIGKMYNRLIKIGNLPIGILSVQYSRDERRKPAIEDKAFAEALERCYEEICAVMRRRIVHPGPLRQLVIKITGRLATARYR